MQQTILNIIPELVNERVHVGKHGSIIALCATIILWMGEPEVNDNERWKRFPIIDWKIYKLHDGAKANHQYRQYEFLLDLEEIGFQPGIIFPARF